ncbi:MAG TPA: DUF488 family protein [Terriglobales bacterium]|nr:DUF488 family protein [Terriglobales bacterium]
MAIAVKRVYEKPSRSDGTRVLVDRLWPRGLTKEAAALDAWLKELAPSDELRRWVHEHREAWPLFRKHYFKELTRPEATEQLQKLYDLSNGRKRLTLLYASRDEERNNAVVLKEFLEGTRKPPTGTGPARAVSRLRKTTRRPS